VVDRYFPIFELLEDELDSIEGRIFAPEGYALSLLVMGGLDLYLFFRFKRVHWL
jgi:hypothetical protein